MSCNLSVGLLPPLIALTPLLCASHFKSILLQVSKYSEDMADIVVHLVIANPEEVGTRRTLPENHTCVLLIGDEDNRVVYKRKIM